MSNLLDLLHKADGVEIDGTFCRHFHLEIEECEEDGDIAMDLSFEADYNQYEYLFTKAALENAVPNIHGDGWIVSSIGEMGSNNCNIIPYKLKELKA